MLRELYRDLDRCLILVRSVKIVRYYSGDIGGGEWILVGLAILILVIILGSVVLFVYFVLRKYIRFRSTAIEQESLLEEVSNLNNEVAKLVKEKEEIMAMKVSKLGLKPDESDAVEEEEEVKTEVDTRFAKLHSVDEAFAKYKVMNYNNNFSLEELVEYFRIFAASQLKLYYSTEMIRLFIAALASTKLIILQGISGTGKTSLAYAWGKFLKHDSCVASVQPSWKR